MSAPCPNCDGTGTVIIELYHRQSFNIDSGYIEERREICPECGGSGFERQDETQIYQQYQIPHGADHRRFFSL